MLLKGNFSEFSAFLLCIDEILLKVSCAWRSLNTSGAWSNVSSHHSSEITESADAWTSRKRLFHYSDDMQEGGDWWHTYLVPGSITVVMFPLSIKCIWFPAEGVAGRAEIWQQCRGQEGSSCEHHFHWCAWKRTKSGNAYTIRAETLSDLIFERGLSPQRVLLIHRPEPLCGEGLYNGGWQNDMLRGAWKCLRSDCRNEFSGTRESF